MPTRLNIYGQAISTIGGISIGINGDTELTPPESIFVPFNQLQETTALGWISGSLDIDNLQSVLINDIETPKVNIYNVLNKKDKIQSSLPIHQYQVEVFLHKNTLMKTTSNI